MKRAKDTNDLTKENITKATEKPKDEMQNKLSAGRKSFYQLKCNIKRWNFGI